VVVDSRGRTPASARVLSPPARTLVATTDASSQAWRRQMGDAAAEVLVLPALAGRVDLGELLRHLAGRDILSLLVEGGGELLGSFFDLGLVDKVQAIVAPVIIGGKEAPTAVAGRGARRMADALRLRDVSVERLGEDVLVTGYIGREEGSGG
jgi:diaminohydroxyphosphoribosylaminopyrimidine deaminase/5-amino-6-(5-phosphoribosylamino)uracil reductase